MKVYQHVIQHPNDIEHIKIPFKPTIFFLFVSHSFPNIEDFLNNLNKKYEEVVCIGCSTSGEIIKNEVLDATVSLTAVKFEKTKLKIFNVNFESYGVEENIYNTGSKISENLISEDLRHIFIFSDKAIGNGIKLFEGLNSNLNKNISITGGIAGDNNNDTNIPFVIYNNKLKTKKIVALGLYGVDLKIGIGCRGGWDSFGIERKVTKAKDNIIYELDGKPALQVYKSFLGDKANDLPSSAITFPLSMRNKNNETPVVRAVVDINEKDQSLLFIGKIPENSYIRGMKANIDRLINGAEQAAIVCQDSTTENQKLGIIVSCTGRRLVMKQLVEEEVEAVNEVFGNNIYTTGFYSRGEISPFNKFSPCLLHNQTFSMTTLSE